MNPLDNGVHPLSWQEVFMGSGLILLSIWMTSIVKTDLRKDLVVGMLRTTGQLFLMGYVLDFIFKAQQWYWVMGFMALMVVMATHTSVSRQTNKARLWYPVVAVSLIVGVGTVLVIVMGVIIGIEPWYNPQYLIPMGGMVLGTAMSATALVLERLRSELSQRRAEVETLLALGASREQASEEAVRTAVKAAMIPNINAMMVVGIVSFPGTMTGQILAGLSPITSINYQIVVMFMITAAVAISTVCVAKLAIRHYFTPRLQINTELL